MMVSLNGGHPGEVVLKQELVEGAIASAAAMGLTTGGRRTRMRNACEEVEDVVLASEEPGAPDQADKVRGRAVREEPIGDDDVG